MYDSKNALVRYYVFFFQAEDGIRDYKVTGVQTCALPIFLRRRRSMVGGGEAAGVGAFDAGLFGPLRRRGGGAPVDRLRRWRTASATRWRAEWERGGVGKGGELGGRPNN